MTINDNAHVPFAQLASEERFFYSLAAQAAILCLRPYLAAIGVAGEEICLSRVWDENKFARADATDFFRYSDRLEPYLVHFVVTDPNFWCRRLAARRSSRRKRK